MTKYAGKDVAISVDTGSGTYVAIGGLKTKSMKGSSGAINVTDSDSPGRWREILDGSASEVSFSISASGHFIDDTAIAAVQDAFFSSALKSYKVLIPGLGLFEGLFMVSEFSFDGAHDGAVEQTISLESSSQITFTD